MPTLFRMFLPLTLLRRMVYHNAMFTLNILVLVSYYHTLSNVLYKMHSLADINGGRLENRQECNMIAIEFGINNNETLVHISTSSTQAITNIQN